MPGKDNFENAIIETKENRNKTLNRILSKMIHVKTILETVRSQQNYKNTQCRTDKTAY